MSYIPYENYSPSKTYLLDEIPSNWEIVPMNQFVELVTDYVANGSFASLRENVEYKNEEDYAILVRLADNSNNFEGPFVYINEEAYNFLSKSKLYEGDIVLSNTGSIGSIFKVPNLGKPMSLAPNSLLIRFRNQTLANYFFYFFNCDIGRKFLESITTVTTQPKFNKTDFRKLPILMPPIEEQKQIANYLDKKTAKIDAVIAKNEELIQLLEEKRVALINKVVTKGLNPDVDMKDSGVEWIGEIPEHWNLTKFRNVLQERTEKNNPIKSKERLSLSIDKGVTLYAEKTTNLDRFKDDFTQYKLAYEGDLVLNSMNMIVGAVGVSKYFGCVSPVYYTYYDETKDNIITTYCDYLFKTKTIKKFLRSLGRGIMSIDRGDDRINTCRLKVSRDDLRNMYVPYPPLSEQKQINKYLDEECERIAKITSIINKHIKLLNEYKTSLIHHVVTGKIDVRGEEI